MKRKEKALPYTAEEV